MNHPNDSREWSSHSLARAAGVAYLVVIAGAGFAQGGVREALVVWGDAPATAANILDNLFLFRLGMASDLLAFIADALVAVLLYTLLRPWGQTLSLAAAALRLVAHPAIGSLNMLNQWAAIQAVSTSGGDSGIAAEQALQAMELHATGYLIAGVFFGVHLLLLGVLLYRSGLTPRALSMLVGVAGVGYLIESFGIILFPTYADMLVWAVMVPAVLAEVPLAMYMAVRGART